MVSGSMMLRSARYRRHLSGGVFKLRPSLILGLQHAADSACRAGRIDVSKMEELLGALLANQLAEFSKSAGGKLPG
jgi:hypothetical protein